MIKKIQKIYSSTEQITNSLEKIENGAQAKSYLTKLGFLLPMFHVPIVP